MSITMGKPASQSDKADCTNRRYASFTGKLSLLSVISFGLSSTLTDAMAAPPWQPTGAFIEWADGTIVTLGSSADPSLKIDCSKTGNTGIVIDGTVTLVAFNSLSEGASPENDHPQIISITCPYILFKNNAQINLTERLSLRAEEQAAGDIRITNVRGRTGAEAPPRPDLWKITKQDNGAPGSYGGDGGSAGGVPPSAHGAAPGGNGGNGGKGGNGQAAANGGSGEPGKNGYSAADMDLHIKSFADGALLHLSAIGGAGGKGGRGGRGQDGGDGGPGGQGGKGGDGDFEHGGATGGSGGPGGDGNNGGNGGQGGQGGNGGNGGNIQVWLLKGGQAPEDGLMVTDGGTAGEGGEGGDFGLGGAGGKGGDPGCGGSNGTFFGTWHTGGGTCGTNGVPGQPGKNGQKGPPGPWGVAGSNGVSATMGFTIVSAKDFGL